MNTGASTASTGIYKEIFINFEHNLHHHEDVNLNNSSTNKISMPFDAKPKGFIFSNSKYILFGTIESNHLFLTINQGSTEVVNQLQNVNENMFIKRYNFNFTYPLLDNISCVSYDNNDNIFLITCFLEKELVYQIEFCSPLKQSDNCPYEVHCGNYSKLINNNSITNVEFINKSDDKKRLLFAIASITGEINLCFLKRTTGRNIVFESAQIINPNGSMGFTKYIGSFFTKAPTITIKSMKYIESNLLCYITSNHNFYIHDILKNKNIFTKCLVRNPNAEAKILDTKIVYYPFEVSNDGKITTKIFSFGIYVEYETVFALITFDLYFTNIEYKYVKNKYSIFDLEELNINLGEEIVFKNSRVSNLSGRLIDMKIMDKKFWLITENKNLEYDISEYEFNIWNLYSRIGQQIETKNYMDIINNTIANNIRIINHVKTIEDTNTRCDFLKIIIRNSDIVSQEALVEYFALKESSFNSSSSDKLNIINIYSYIDKMSNIKDIEIILERVFNKILRNQIHSLSYIKINELQGQCMVRSEGLSFIRLINGLEQQENIVTQHEFNLRKTVFDSANLKKYLINNPEALNTLKIKVSTYIMHQTKENENNNFYIILALLRIYMTDMYLYIEDFTYTSEYFKNHQHNSSTFIKDHFYHYSSNHFNHKLNFTDIFHQIIFDLLLNQPNINIMVNNWIIEYDNYTRKLMEMQKDYKMSLNRVNNVDITMNNVNINEQRNNTIFNSKFCKIMNKISSNIIKCIYKMNRDLLSFCNWVQNFSKYYKEDLVFVRNLERNGLEKVKEIFYDSYASFLLSDKNIQLSLSSGTYASFFMFQKFSKVNESDVKFSELKMIENIGDNGYDFFKTLENASIDFSVSSLWVRFSNFEQQGEDLKPYFYKIADKLIKIKEFHLLSLMIKLRNWNKLENIWLDLICQANLGNIILVKTLVSSFFNLVIEIEKKLSFEKKDIAEEFYLFETYLQEMYGINKIISKEDKIEIFSKRLLYFNYLKQIISPLLNPNYLFEFYITCDFYVTPSFTSNETLGFSTDKETIMSKYYQNLFENCLKVDMDYSFTFLSIITKYEVKYKCFENIIDYFISINKINLLKRFINNRRDTLIILEIINSRCSIYEKDMNKLFAMITRINIINGEENKSLGNHNHNYFRILYNFYYECSDFYNAGKILFSYSRLIDNLLRSDGVITKVSSLTCVYEEITEILKLSIDALSKVQNSLDLHYIKLNENEIEFITIDTMKTKLKMTSLIVEFLYFLKKKEELTKIGISDEVLNLKGDQNFLGYIISHNEIDLLLNNGFLDCLCVDKQEDKNIAKYLIKRIVKVIKGYTVKINNQTLSELQTPNMNNLNRLLIENENKNLKLLITHVLSSRNYELNVYLYECCIKQNIFIKSNHELFLYLIRTNPARFLDLLTKYRLVEDAVICIESLIKNRVSVPLLAVDNICSILMTMQKDKTNIKELNSDVIDLYLKKLNIIRNPEFLRKINSQN